MKNFFPKLFLTISICILLWTFYRSEIFWAGENREYYKVYYICSVALLLFSCLCFFLNKNINIFIFIFLFCFSVVLFLTEYYLSIDSENKYKAYVELKKIDPNIVLIAHPSIYLKNNDLDILPLSGISNSKTFHCNENGYYSVYESDRYGFNNPNEEWNKNEIQYFLLGDSFTHGACVNRPNDISSQLRNLSKKNVLNVGMSSSGILSQYATLLEYFPKNTKKVLWLIYEGNDIQNLNKELKNQILYKYFDNYKFSQNLKNKQKSIDEIAKIKINNKIKSYENEQSQFIKLYKTRQKFFNKKSYVYTEKFYNFTALEKIISNGNKFVENNNSKLYLICLPAVQRYYLNFNFEVCDKLKKISIHQKIPFLDLHKSLFSKNINVKEFFPLFKKKPVHYSVKGYKEVSEKIYFFTNNN